MTNLIHDRGRGPEIVGTRITVYDIFPYLEAGRWTHAGIADILSIRAEQLAAAIAYIDAHRDEVLAVHRQIEERNARGNPPEIEAKLVETRKKMAAWKAEREREGQGAGHSR